jgi:hypothetical protein
MRLCLFCDEKSATREHAWPKWILRSVSTGRGEHITAQFGPGEAPQVWAGEKVALQVRRVCSGCNSGWMSDLESLAQPVIGPLIHDVGFNLDEWAQLVISIWAVKTAMVLESASTLRPGFYTQAERKGLSQCAFPANTVVWVGRYSHSYCLFAVDHKLNNPTNESIFEEATVVTFAIGRLAIQVLTHRLKPRVRAQGLLPPQTKQFGRFFSQIWPTRSCAVTWPPKFSLSDSGVTLDDASTRFSPPKLSYGGF